LRSRTITRTPLRLLGAETVIESGLNDGDVLVTEGHLLLTYRISKKNG
jgi:hypothetical protein